MPEARRAPSSRPHRAVLLSVLLASFGIHTLGLVVIGLRAPPSRRDAMFRGDDGENGRGRGAGATSTFEVSPPARAQSGAEPAPLPTPAQPTPAETTPSPITVTHPSPRPRPTTTRPAPVVATAPVSATTIPAPVTAPQTPAQPAVEAPEPEPTRSAGGSSGQLTGSVGEQRAMLPRAARCNDPVAGTWRAHKYSPGSRDWVIFTVRINRLPDNRLQGSIRSRNWRGYAPNSRPPGRCGERVEDFDYLVRMPAQGSLTNGNRVSFSAITYVYERVFCASAGFSYNPDALSGTIDEALQEFQSVNNDGGRDQNAPYVFRRIGCLPGDVAAPAAVTAPIVAGDGGAAITGAAR
jgi:hypothetical protein